MIRVLLVDDHAMMREGLRAVLEKESNVEVVGEAENGREALALARDAPCQVVVMDVSMPSLNGIETARRLRQLDPRIKIVALSVHAEKRYVLAMLAAGATGYVLKSAAARSLMQAIRAVVAGRSYLCPEVASVAVDYIAAREAAAAPASDLTSRQREIVQLLAEGRSSKEVATELHIAVATVETHRREIMRKLDLHSVVELTRYALREGLSQL